MDVLFTLCGSDPFTNDQQTRAAAALEGGKVIVLADCGFGLHPDEYRLLNPALLGGAKNISLDPSGALKHTAASRTDQKGLQAMMSRFAARSTALVEALIPAYRGQLERGRTSFRPAEIEGRRSSALKDDTRLHVDAFPTTPMGERRILRVFANVNPTAPRLWHVGEPFAEVARRFLPRVGPSSAAWNGVLAALGITKGRRTAYDDLMLGLHNGAKLDLSYQRDCPKEQVAFGAGTVWLCYTDQVMHAALKGQHALEQTFHLPVTAMADPATSPLKVLERMMGRSLA